MNSRAVGIVGAGLLLAACSADLSGHLFVTMLSGDVKRAADVEVILVGATAEFEAEWAKAVQEFKAAYAEANAVVSDARRQAEEANERVLRDIRSGFFRSSSSDETDRSIAAAARVDEVVKAHRAHALKLIQWGQKGTARTDVNGHYAIRGLRPGKYLLYAHYRVSDRISLHWLVPVEVKSGTATLDLSNSNAGWPFGYQS